MAKRISVSCTTCWLLAFAAFFLGMARVALGVDQYAYVVEGNGNFDQVNLTTGAKSVISNSSYIYFGLAFNQSGTVLYGIVTSTKGSPTALVTISPVSGANTLVGGNALSISVFTSLANGQLFGVDRSDNLVQINPQTGVATVVGSTGLPVLSTLSSFQNSLASDGTTLYYTLASNEGNSMLYKLNTTSGGATFIGSTGTTGIVGSAYAGSSPTNGQLYGFGKDGYTYTINRSTGAATKVSQNGIPDIFGGVGDVTRASFFNGQVFVGNGVDYLSFPNGNYFGFYSYLSDPNYIYHFDLGYEYVFDAADGKNGVYFYDFASNTFFYTSPTFPFPYLYDFSLNTVLYYFPEPSQTSRYTSNPRYFYNFATGQIVTK